MTAVLGNRPEWCTLVERLMIQAVMTPGILISDIASQFREINVLCSCHLEGWGKYGCICTRVFILADDVSSLEWRSGDPAVPPLISPSAESITI